jgi:ferredoxin
MKITLACFSATGNTRKIAEAICARLNELGADAAIWDITIPADRQREFNMQDCDALLLGSPIHSMRAPRLVRDWIAGLKGDGKKCATFFTYGGFQVHPTHFDACQRLKKQGFQVVASADFPGAHTFNLGGWQSMAGRPDESDQTVAREYAEKVYQRFSGQDESLVPELDEGPYTEEQLDQFEGFRFKMVTMLPTRGGEECQLCMLCEEQCPSGAMNAETGQADPEKCIVCLRCVQICPDEALKINDLSAGFNLKIQMDHETAATLAAKKSRMYL